MPDYMYYVSTMKCQSLTEWLFLGVLLIIPATSTGFLLSDDQCVISAPCSCDSSAFRCSNANLTDVPMMTIVNSTYFSYRFVIVLSGNSITSLSKNAFENITCLGQASRPAFIHILLLKNEIASIDPSAFSGIEHSITYLQLQDNRLTSLPVALEKLDRLQTLILSQNPISYIDPAIVSHLGRSLIHFNIDMHELKTWQSLSKLQLLKDLYIDFIPFKYLALDSFPTNLDNLVIMNSTLARVPVAICHLHNLNRLSIAFSSVLDSDESLVEQCSTPLEHMDNLELQGGNFNTFPNVLLVFPSLGTLRLDNNDMQFIHTDVIPQSSYLHDLSLSGNSFAHIPFALNKLTNLTSLDMSHNRIATVEDNDLIGLRKLWNLNLGNNPIVYIAPDAFKNNMLISMLALDNTLLHLVPKMVRSLPSLNTFIFSNNSVECSCSLTYLKGWNVAGVHQFEGVCADTPNDPIKQYIMTQLPQCP